MQIFCTGAKCICIVCILLVANSTRYICSVSYRVDWLGTFAQGPTTSWKVQLILKWSYFTMSWSNHVCRGHLVHSELLHTGQQCIYLVLSYLAAWLGTFVQGPIVSERYNKPWDQRSYVECWKAGYQFVHQTMYAESTWFNTLRQFQLLGDSSCRALALLYSCHIGNIYAEANCFPKSCNKLWA